MKNIKTLEKYLNSFPSKMLKVAGQVLKECNIEILSDLDVYCRAKVESQSGMGDYVVELTDIGQFGASCECKYYENNGTCKHIGAVVTKVIQDKTMSLPSKSTSKQKFKSADISIPYQSLTQEYVESLSTDQNKSEAKNFPLKSLSIKELWKGHVRAELKESYYINVYKITIDVLEENLRMQCSCKQTAAPLCSHKHILLQAITKNYSTPDVLKELPAKEELQDTALAEYGFSAKDKNVDKLFKFEITSSGTYKAVPVESGIIKTSSYKENSKNFWSNLHNIHVPVELPETSNEANNKVYAFVINGPYIYNNLCVATNFTIITGDPGKEKTQLLKNIYSREESLLKRLTLPTSTEKSEQIFDLIHKLNENYLISVAKKCGKKGQDLSHYLTSIIVDALHGLKKLLKDEIIYTNSTGFFSKSSLQRLSIAETTPEIRFIIKNEPPFISLVCKVFNDNKEIKILRNGYGFYYWVIEEKIVFISNVRDVELISKFIDNPVLKVHQSDEENFIKEQLSSLGKYYSVELEMAKKVKKRKASFNRIALYLSEQGNFLLLRPVVHYNEGEVDLFTKEEIFRMKEGTYIHYQRSETAEGEVKDKLSSAHPDFSKQTERGFFYLHFDNLFENGWYFTFFNQLKEWGIPAFGLEKIKRANYYPYRPTIKTKISSGIDWFDIHIDINFGDNSVSLKEVQKALLRKENYVQLGDGTIGLLPQEWIEKHASLLRTAEVDKSGNAKLTKLHFNILDELLEEVSDAAIIEEINVKKQKLLQFNGIGKHALPGGLEVTMRPYQQEGYNWLMFLDEFGWGGCLADDMGLGKTVQMIAFLKKQHDLHPGLPNLVILPTTLIFNWKRELQKFAPGLEYLDFSGTQRDKQQNFSKFPVVLTTYGLIINDIEQLRKTTFNYIILDESQAIKNPSSQRFKAVSLLRSRNKIVMTGTPVENNTFDLYAQMTFANPGLLGNLNHFQSHFSTPIDKNGDKDAANSLRKLISPFLLRRTKEQVANDLPDKTEDVIVCEMENEQRRVYNAFKDNYRQSITKNIDNEGLGKSSIMVLDALLKLRQICNSPALLNVQEDYGNDSIKIKELLRHLTEKTGKHKVLVFSQFTQMLKLVEKELHRLGMSYEYLDGQTPGKDREQKVKKFQEDASIRVFLISLKAGGVGLNLTEADYVYLIDPWWNPAVEAQAIDRTHRIGQKNKVFAYRMICKDTIEEKVLQLQERKRKVAQDLISTEAAFYKQLDKADIIDLFR